MPQGIARNKFLAKVGAPLASAVYTLNFLSQLCASYKKPNSQVSLLCFMLTPVGECTYIDHPPE